MENNQQNAHKGTHDGAESLAPNHQAAPLTSTEQDALKRHEKTLDAAEHHQLQAAQALLDIRTERLYRQTHASFEQYCIDQWDIQRAHAHRLCNWATVVDMLRSPYGDAVPQREAHARPLYGLKPDQQRDIWGSYLKMREGKRDATPLIEQCVKKVLAAVHGTAITPVSKTTDDGNLFCGDVLTVLPTLGDGSINLVVTSPPYADQRHGHYPGVPEARHADWMTKVMAALRPKLAADASVLIVIRPHIRDGVVSDYVLRTRLALRDSGWFEIDEYVWHKGDGGINGSKIRLRRVWESILHFAPTRRPYIDLRACGNASERIGFKGHDRFGLNGKPHLVDGFSQDYSAGRSRASDVFKAPVGSNAAGVAHPAVFPIGLAEQLVKTFSRPSDLVADIFAGSGTTLLAAQALDRRYLGIDIMPEYVNLCRYRLRQRSDAA